MREVPIGSLFAHRVTTIDPRLFPKETFELWSIPAYDRGTPDIEAGSSIGSPKKCVEPNDVLLSRIVPHIRRATVVTQHRGQRQIASSEWIIFRSPDFFPDYLKHALLTDRFHAQFMNTTAGVGGSLVRARPGAVAKVLIPLPPIEEQRRIAAILDQADDLRRKRRVMAEKLEPLPQAIFQQMFGSAHVGSENYPVRSLGELIGVSSGDGLTQAQIIAGPFPVYGGNGINGYHNDFIVPSGTIIIGRVGVYCGAIHVTKSNAWVTDNALIVSVKSDAIKPTYLAAALTNARLNQYAARSSQPLISGGRLYHVKIAVPPIEVQERFALAVTAAASTSQTSNKQLLLTEELFASLQAQAFDGAL